MTAITRPPLCIDCRYARHHKIQGSYARPSVDTFKCARSEKKDWSPVTGTTITTRALCEQVRADSERCGLRGAWFEPRHLQMVPPAGLEPAPLVRT